MREYWELILEKEYFKFSCGHFLIFPDGSKERIHGHNYRVSVEIRGDLSKHGLVLDFIQVKPVIREICDGLDEHLLLPGQHHELQIDDVENGHRAFRYRDCEYKVPDDEVIVLPINNSSVENISAWFAYELKSRLLKRFPEFQLFHLKVAIAETDGQWARYIIEETE